MLKLDVVNIVCIIINLLILYFLMTKFLIGPVMSVIEKRNTLIASQFAEAEAAKTQAKELKDQYENDLKQVKEKSIEIMENARAEAQTEYDRIVTDADERAKSILNKAHADIALEKEKTLKDMESEIGGLVAMAVDKVAGTKNSAETDKDMIDQFLSEVNV